MACRIRSSNRFRTFRRRFSIYEVLMLRRDSLCYFFVKILQRVCLLAYGEVSSHVMRANEGDEQN